MEVWEALAQADDLIVGVERGEYYGVEFWVRNMTNMYHSLLYGEGEHARTEGFSENGDDMGRMNTVFMRIVYCIEGGGDGIGGGVEAQVVAARPERHSFHVVLKACMDLAERSCTFKEW